MQFGTRPEAIKMAPLVHKLAKYPNEINLKEGLKLNGTFHLDQGYTYFRNVENRVLIGGGRNLNIEGETTTTAGTTAQIQSYLEDILSTIVLPNTPYKIAQRWSGTMAFDAQQTPIIEAISPNVYAAIRCNGMGVAISSRMGEAVAKLMV